MTTKGETIEEDTYTVTVVFYRSREADSDVIEAPITVHSAAIQICKELQAACDSETVGLAGNFEVVGVNL